MRTAEEAAFARGVEVEALMDKAGAGIARAVTRFFGKPGKCIVFAGKGHNAGDALVAAERLRRRGWKIEVRLAFQEADCSGMMRKKLESLRRRPPEILGATPSRGSGTDLGIILVELFAEAAEELTAAQEAITAEAKIQHVQKPMWPHWCCCRFQGIYRCSSDDFARRVACRRRAGRGFCP